MTERNHIIGKWLWAYFWLCHLGMVCYYLADFLWFSYGETAYHVLLAVHYGCAILDGLIFLKLADYETAFERSAYVTLVVSITEVGLRLFGYEDILYSYSFFFTMPMLLGSWYSYQAFAGVLWQADPDLARKWFRLWKRFMICYVAGYLLMVQPNFLVTVLYLLSQVGVLLCAVTESVYVFRTARILMKL